MKALFTLNPYIWKYRKHLLLGILFVTISNLFGVYPPQIVRNAIDYVGDLIRVHALHEGSDAQAELYLRISQSLLLFAGIVIGLALMRGVFLFFTRQTLIVMSRLIEYDLRNDIYEHYQQLSLTFFRKNKTGDLMARISEDVSRVRMYLGPGIMYTINTFTLIVIVVSTMISVNPELTLYTLIPLPVLSLSIYFLQSVIQRKSDRIQKQLSRLTSYAQEIFSGIRVVKAYAREEETSDKIVEESNLYLKRSMDLARLNSMFHPMVMLLVGASIVLTIWVGGTNVISGDISLGNIAEFVLYVNMLTWPIVAIGWVTTLIQRAAASQERLNELFRQKSEIEFPDEGPEMKSASLEFRNVSYTYPHTGITAVKDLSFELKPGELLGILGHTGSGKSTVCNLIPRLLDPDSGEIFMDGRPQKLYTKDGLRCKIGYAPQEVFLFSDTVKGNVAFGYPNATDEDVKEATRKACIYDSIVEFPEQFETRVGERGVTLSGGQKQRLAIARAWVRNPLLLILDDSLSAVDTATEEEILGNLSKARKDRPEMAVMLVSHRISTLQEADRILVMKDGMIIEEGSHKDLLSQDGYYSGIHQKQLLESEIQAGRH